MASYSIEIKRTAAKELEALPLKDRKRIVAKIRKFAADPRPTGCEKLVGNVKYRFRQGDYRILYSVDNQGGVIVTVKIGHRRDVYQ